ncbi:hypothetical protein ACLHOE_003385 [Salmonella enterica subsp. enterica serovar Newport]|nr:hypothetical protein [Salmonella enterica subsp. enterica serovar Shubra]ECM2357461.1 hypothetical protein [Salmonella enterica subsp. enterica serovar Newport]EDA0796669.1 hypothetical protein [Salmonella enterica]EDA4997835.1 hypothetical protein [Salmonella enterica subsp. enterica serovar Newport]EDE2488660.1 hypothetical protein [Salmonella enterica subsp. enterica serovar Shubra]
MMPDFISRILSKISSNEYYSFFALLVFLIYLAIEFINIKKKKAFTMKSTPLTDQHLFWTSIRVPFLGFIYFGIFSWYEYSFQFNQIGFNKFIEISKLPLGLLSLCIPLVAIVNGIHRTIQTDDQIKQTKYKNISDQFYAHQKSHIEYFSSILQETIEFVDTPNETTKHIIKVDSPFKLYKKSFPNSSIKNSDFEVNVEFIYNLGEFWGGIEKHIDELSKSNTNNERFRNIHEIEKRINNLCKIAYFTPLKRKYVYYLDHTSYIFCSKFEGELDLKKTIKAYLNLTQDLFDILDGNLNNQILSEYLINYVESDLEYFSNWKTYKKNIYQHDSAHINFQEEER